MVWCLWMVYSIVIDWDGKIFEVRSAWGMPDDYPVKKAARRD
jgi:hypothetical protein